eukprot:gene33993-56692_t
MTVFLASLAGIPPLGGWFAKFGAFKAVLDADTNWGYSIAIIAALNTVIAAAYYITVMREIWMKPVPDGDVTPIRTPSSIQAALVITCGATIVLAISPVPSDADPHGAPSAVDDIRRAIDVAGGALRFDEFMSLALYGPNGFYTGEGRAGRRGDFLTSPEVGPLFGTVLAAWIEAEFDRLGRPDGFEVVEVGAGP